MTVKTTLLTLFLTGFGLAAQIPSFPAPRTNAPPDAVTRAAMGTNRQDLLRQELRRALAGGTNAAAPGTAVNPVKPPVGTDSSAPPAAVRNTPPPLSAAKPDSLTPPPGVLPASSAPGSSLPAASAPPIGAVAPPPGATNSSLEEPLQPGIIDFRSADLNQVLEVYSIMVNRTILRPSTLPAPPITLTTHGQLTVREGIQALEAVLGLNGITMVNMGDKFVKAMPEAQGITAGARFDTNTAAHLPEMGQYVTHIVQLKYAKPSEMLPVLQPFGKIAGGILPIDVSQILVLRDYTENIKRMLEMIEKIDVAIPSEFVSEVIPIKYAKASEIAGALNSLSSGGGGATVGGGGGTGGTTTRSTRTSGMGGMGGIGGMNRPGGMGGYPGQTMSGMGTQTGLAGTTATGQPGSSFSQRLQSIINRASATGDIQVLGQTKIISDERTNSLLIYASKEDMKIIKDIIAKLDVVLAQVLIEAVIIEVSLKNSRDLGISWIEKQTHGTGSYKGIGAINSGNLLSQSPLVSTATNVANNLPGGFAYLGSFGQDLDVTVTAMASDSRARIVQRPRIQTSHNEPASLFVGESRPYPTSSYYGGGAYGGSSTIQQMQIGVTLEVTPLINPDGLVVMEIRQQIDSVSGTVTIANVGEVPVTSSKSASTKVSVRDHDTIILGGLIETDKSKNASGVPFLMDIPLLGYLFRTSTLDENRSELIVLIRPTVLPTPEIAALAATAEKNRMPGVRATEREMQAEETRRLRQANQAEKVDSNQPVEKQ
jgi:general secretion pathway protein D